MPGPCAASVKRDLLRSKRDLLRSKSDLLRSQRDLLRSKRDLLRSKRDLVRRPTNFLESFIEVGSLRRRLRTDLALPYAFERVDPLRERDLLQRHTKEQKRPAKD